MAGTGRFGEQLDRIREAERPATLSVSDQLRLLKSTSGTALREHALPDEGTLPPGRVVETEAGAHYLIEEAWPQTHSHGNVRLSRLESEDLDVLVDLAGLGASRYRRDTIVFLDTETTGVHGGAGMCPFLIGIGYYAGDQFEVRQYFIRDFDEEESMLRALGDFLRQFELIVTYNGRAFDAPLVENRCVLARLDRMAHLDLLYMARRLWKASQGSCRLIALEEKILRFLRGADIPGSKIPQTYFDYVRHGRAGVLRKVFSHNAYDILSLAALTIEAADRVIREPAPLEDPRDVYSLAKLFDRGPERGRSSLYYERALESVLPDKLRMRALERLSVLYRRSGRVEDSLACCLELTRAATFSFPGYEGAALCYERRSRDFEAACGILDEGIGRIRGVEGMERRLARLEERRDRLNSKRNRSRLSAISHQSPGPLASDN
jgi:hypothetical protein